MLVAPYPIRMNGQHRRANLIPIHLNKIALDRGADCIVLNEMMSHALTRSIQNKLHELGWMYRSTQLSFNPFKGKLMRGGVIILSRYPIVFTASEVFDRCQGSDCLVSKGVVIALIQKNYNLVAVLGTHLQAWDNEQSKRIRNKQLSRVSQFITRLQLPEEVPVILSGDLNIDYYTSRPIIQQIEQSLYLKVPKIRITQTSPVFTVDPEGNTLVGNDDPTGYITQEYPDGCYESYMNTLACDCCKGEWLDYVMYHTKHLTPTRSYIECIRLKSSPFNTQLSSSTERIIDDLSDHFPVIGILEFPRQKHLEIHKIVERARTMIDRPNTSSCDFMYGYMYPISIVSLLFCLYLIIRLRSKK
jgi:endonuclease/exonuclease/phosphatase family metal-dependent hydrolase